MSQGLEKGNSENNKLKCIQVVLVQGALLDDIPLMHHENTMTRNIPTMKFQKGNWCGKYKAIHTPNVGAVGIFYFEAGVQNF